MKKELNSMKIATCLSFLVIIIVITVHSRLSVVELKKEFNKERVPMAEHRIALRRIEDIYDNPYSINVEIYCNHDSYIDYLQINYQQSLTTLGFLPETKREYIDRMLRTHLFIYEEDGRSDRLYCIQVFSNDTMVLPIYKEQR